MTDRPPVSGEPSTRAGQMYWQWLRVTGRITDEDRGYILAIEAEAAQGAAPLDYGELVVAAANVVNGWDDEDRLEPLIEALRIVLREGAAPRCTWVTSRNQQLMWCSKASGHRGDHLPTITPPEGAAPRDEGLDAIAFLDSLRTPRNSLGKLALPKGHMEWAVEEAWVPPAVEELDDTGDGVMIHRLSELADLIIDRLQARLSRPSRRVPESEEPR